MRKILIIEDQPDVSAVYRMTLEDEGYEIIEFDDPREALTYSSRIDLIVLDERLRGLSGSDYIPDLKRAFPDAPIIMATADPVAVKAAVDRGAAESKMKPFTMKEFKRNIRGFLGEG